MAENSAEMGLPPEATAPPNVETPAKTSGGWLDNLKAKLGFARNRAAVTNGPIPGVTPATPEELAGGPKVSLPAEQADQDQQVVQSAQRVA